MTSMRTMALVAGCLLACGAQAAQSTAPVTVTGGQIAGTKAGDVNTFLGVPFAAPPVGNLRWRPPQPVVPWHGVKEAQAFAPACAQTAPWVPNPKSEDCLHLNVWTPAQAQKLPVIVRIHGGGFYGGTAAMPMFDGGALARRGVVVVTINYRLGIFGFFAHPELTAESPDKASGNQGMEDQVAALLSIKVVAVGQRQLNVLNRAHVGDQVECLKDETDFAIANARTLRQLQTLNGLAVQRVCSIRRRIEQAQDGQKG